MEKEPVFGCFLLFVAAAFLVAGLLYTVFRDKSMMPWPLRPTIKRMSIEEGKAYIRRLGQFIALLSIAPAVGGLLALFFPVPVALIAMLVLFIALPILGKKVIYEDMSKDDTEQ